MKNLFVFAIIVALFSCKDDPGTPVPAKVSTITAHGSANILPVKKTPAHPTPPPAAPPTPPPTPPPAPANSLDALPKDTGGTHTPMPLGKDAASYGYYIYKPSGYTDAGPKFPLLIFLHGSGEIGNSRTDATILDKILVNGPPKLIKQKKWNPEYPMVVISAQCDDSWWDYMKVRKFIEFVRVKYQVDTSRVYLTGLSMGGFGTYDQIGVWGKASHIAAAVPISGSGNVTSSVTTHDSQVPLWAFHGESDPTVPLDFDKAINKAINALNPPVHAKLTLYKGVGHDCWTETYDGTGMGKEDPAYDPFSMDIYSWLLQYKKE